VSGTCPSAFPRTAERQAAVRSPGRGGRSTEAKRKALEAAYQDTVTSDLPEWNQDAGLLDWLASL
jgi:hypothetical protein